MKSMLENLPRYSTEKTQIDARLFNEVKLGLMRLKRSMRFPAHNLRHLDIILDEETWIVVDNSLNDVPVIAWTEFETAHRDNLHKPIGCQLYAYHAHAEIIIDQVLYTIQDYLGQQLTPASTD